MKWKWYALPLGIFFTVFSSPGTVAEDQRKSTIVAGDVNQDGQTDIRDLSELAEYWDESLERFGTSNTRLLGDIETNWRMPVNATLLSLLQANAFTPQMAASTSSKAKHLSPRKRSEYDRKRESLLTTTEKSIEKGFVSDFRALGFGAEFPTDSALVQRPKAQVFKVPVDPETGRTPLVSSTNFANLPGGGFIENTQTGQFPRYDLPIENEVFQFEFSSNYARELDILGFDLELEARYAAITGGTRLDIDRERYSDNTTHRVYIRFYRSYGWFYMPDDEIEKNLTADFRTLRDKLLCQNSLDPEDDDPPCDPLIDLTETYGDYYAVAQHRAASILISVDITTASEVSKESIEADIDFKYDSIEAFVDFRSAFNKLRERYSNLKDIKVTSTVVGGPATINIDGNSISLAAALSAFDSEVKEDAESGSAFLAKIIREWTTKTNIENSVPVDYLYRSIAERFAGQQKLPWDKGVSLRAWFRRYNEAYQQLARAQLILTDSGATLSEDPNEPPLLEDIRVATNYNYVLSEPPFDPDGTYGGYNDLLSYFGNQYLKSLVVFDSLIQIGQEIERSSGEAPVFFTGIEPGFQVPAFFVPVPGPEYITLRSTITHNSGIPSTNCIGDVTTTWQLSIEGWDFVDFNTRYYPLYYFYEDLYNLSSNTNVPGVPRYHSSYKGAGKWEVSFTFGKTNDTNEANCFGRARTWHSDGRQGMYFGLYDRKTREVIQVACGEPNCDTDVNRNLVNDRGAEIVP